MAGATPYVPFEAISTVRRSTGSFCSACAASEANMACSTSGAVINSNESNTCPTVAGASKLPEGSIVVLLVQKQ